MTVPKDTLTTGTVPKHSAAGRAPAHLGCHHTVRIPGIGVCDAVGMSPTRSHPGPAAELNPEGVNRITQKFHRVAKQPIADDERLDFVGKRETPAPLNPGVRSRRNDSANGS